MTHEDMVTHFFQSFCRADFDGMAAHLEPDIQSYITNSEGGVNHLSGRDAFMASIKKMDVIGAKPEISITQMAPIDANQMLVMVEIKAARKGLTLHNFAAYLLTFRDGRISSLRMVEALPAFSDEFWSA